jgi:hypothetical protein
LRSIVWAFDVIRRPEKRKMYHRLFDEVLAALGIDVPAVLYDFIYSK